MTMNTSNPVIEPIILQFDRGTLILRPKHRVEPILPNLPMVQWDERTLLHRAPAYQYREIVLTLRQYQVPYQDQARQFEPCALPLTEAIIPRSYQQQALEVWLNSGRRGVVALPTGAGKTLLAFLLMAEVQRPVLIHVPTLDLMQQWATQLQRYFNRPIGLLGGGQHDIQAITVATYDSALIHIHRYGNQFGFLVFDECHHLLGEQYQYLAIASLAPFRLGLTATPEHREERAQISDQLCGPVCFQAHIDELEGKTLAPYQVHTLEVEMAADEWEEYQAARQCYLAFVKAERIDFKQPKGWNTFLWKSSHSPQGREAFQAYLRQKQLSQASSAKEHWIWRLLRHHAGDRIIIFTQDNAMAYRIGQRFFLPVLTHHTKLKEREHFLQAFRQGEYPVLVTSKVLNEGVDVPEANVAIVVSGSGSIREHVQRLGRILRAQPGKQAHLYELVSKATAEYYINQRRRQHRAYQRFTA